MSTGYRDTLASRLLTAIGKAELSVPTPELVATCAAGLSQPRNRVWADLVRLERNGLIVKVTSSHRKNHRGPRPVRWALAQPTEAENAGSLANGKRADFHRE